MKTVALIQSGDELHRQPYADVEGFVETALGSDSERLFCGTESVVLETVTDETVAEFLAGISSSTCGCLIFASNSLASHAVWSATEEHRVRLRTFLDSGGGVLLLHQIRGALPTFLKEGLKFADEMLNLGTVGRSAELVTKDDPLVNYPASCDPLLTVDRSLPPTSPNRLYWRGIEPQADSGLVTVFRSSDGRHGVIARTEGSADSRAVVSAVPLDWHGETDLLRNAVWFCMHGMPDVLIAKRRADLDPSDVFVSSRHSVAFESLNAPVSRQAEWLLAHVETCVLNQHEIPGGDISTVPALLSFVRRGGMIASLSSDMRHGVNRIDVLSGNRASRRVVDALLNDVAAEPGWGEQVAGNPFSMRNIATALLAVQSHFSGLGSELLKSAKQDQLRQTAR